MKYKDPTSWVEDKSSRTFRIKNLKKHRKQRKAKGYSEFDFWNFHNYHSWMMISVLEDFKKGMGHPVDDQIKSMEDWIAILDEMIEGFKASLEISYMDTYDRKIHGSWSEWEKPLREKYERGMELLSKYYFALWD